MTFFDKSILSDIIKQTLINEIKTSQFIKFNILFIIRFYFLFLPIFEQLVQHLESFVLELYRKLKL